jgi:CRP-like cAMP-binding protein
MEAIACQLPTYEVLSVEQIEKINACSHIVRYKKDNNIFRQDMPTSHVLFIKKGLVKIHKESNSGKNYIIKLATPNSYIGLLSFFYTNLFQYSASSLSECEIVFTDLNVFKDIIRDNGQYALQIMRLLSEDGLTIFDKLINMSQKQVPGRVAELLLLFSQKIYNSNTFELPISRQELAEFVSSTKESVSRTLTEFKNDKIIEIDDRKITIKSMDLIQVLSKIG